MDSFTRSDLVVYQQNWFFYVLLKNHLPTFNVIAWKSGQVVVVINYVIIYNISYKLVIN